MSNSSKERIDNSINGLPKLIITLGIIVLAVAFLSMVLRFENREDLGLRQIFLAVFGLLIVLVGIAFTIKPGLLILSQWDIKIREKAELEDLTIRQRAVEILVVAVWFGLLTGFVEGISLTIFQKFHWLAGEYLFIGGSFEIIWISIFFNLFLYGLLGLVIIAVLKIFNLSMMWHFSILFFMICMFFDWLSIPLGGRLVIINVLLVATFLSIEVFSLLNKREEEFKRLRHKSLPWLILLFLFTFFLIEGGLRINEKIAASRIPAAASGSPNLLVIIADTLRADHVSSYGYSRLTSPNIDEISKHGVIFENAISTSNWSLPSHASLFTGRSVHEHNVDENGVYGSRPLDNRYPTIAEVLLEYGYNTGAILGNYLEVNRQTGFGRGFNHIEDYYYSIPSRLLNTFYGWFIEYHILHRMCGLEYRIDKRRSSSITQSGLSWIDHQKGRPFFLFLNYYDIHSPYVPPDPYRDKFSNDKDPGGLISTDWDMDHIYLPMTSQQLQAEIDAYDGAISYVDHNLGDLFDGLKNRGLFDNTIIVIAADHGESLGEHSLLDHHNSLYWEQIHIPLIISWSEHIPEGKRVSQPVSLADLPATLLTIIANTRQTIFPGPSLSKLWTQTGPDLEWPYPIAEAGQTLWLPPKDPNFHGAMKSVVTPRWHYIEHEKFGAELYDWKMDPQELNNLVDKPEMKPVIYQLQGILKR